MIEFFECFFCWRHFFFKNGIQELLAKCAWNWLQCPGFISCNSLSNFCGNDPPRLLSPLEIFSFRWRRSASKLKRLRLGMYVMQQRLHTWRRSCRCIQVNLSPFEMKKHCEMGEVESHKTKWLWYWSRWTVFGFASQGSCNMFLLVQSVRWWILSWQMASLCQDTKKMIAQLGLQKAFSFSRL